MPSCRRKAMFYVSSRFIFFSKSQVVAFKPCTSTHINIGIFTRKQLRITHVNNQRIRERSQCSDCIDVDLQWCPIEGMAVLCETVELPRLSWRTLEVRERQNSM
jgi:hypothetical protein